MHTEIKTIDNQTEITVNLPLTTRQASRITLREGAAEALLREKYGKELAGKKLVSAPRSICNFQSNNTGTYVFERIGQQRTTAPATTSKTTTTRSARKKMATPNEE